MGEKEIIFHIGMPKCASTYLQENVFTQYRNSIDYISGERRERLAPLIYSLSTDLWCGGDEFLNSEHFKGRFDRIVDDFNDSKKTTILISGESFCGHPSGGFGTGRFVSKIINKLPFRKKIILVIRRQDNFFESLYKMHVRKGGRFNKENFLRLDQAGHDFQPVDYGIFAQVKNEASDWRCLDYMKYLEYYENVHGQDSLLILPFELFKDDKARFVNKISTFVGYHDPIVISDRVVNRGASAFEFFFRRNFVNRIIRNRNGTHDPLYNYKYLRLFNLLVRASDRIHYVAANPLKDENKRILDYYMESNRTLSHEIGIDLNQYGYY